MVNAKKKNMRAKANNSWGKITTEKKNNIDK